MSMILSDETLVKEVQLGKKEAYETLIERYEKKIFGFVFRLARDHEAAEDILQETFIKGYEKIQSFDLNRKFSSWIFRIAHNESMNWLRYKAKVTNMGDKYSEIEDEDFIQKLIKELDLKQDKLLINSELQKLPIKFKEAIILKYYEEKSYEELSEIMRIPTGTVGTYISRGKEILKKKLKDKEIL